MKSAAARKPHRFTLADVARVMRNAMTDTVLVDEPETVLHAIGQLRLSVDLMEGRAVAACRAAGMTWDGIAEELGVSRQAAHKRWHHVDTPAV